MMVSLTLPVTVDILRTGYSGGTGRVMDQEDILPQKMLNKLTASRAHKKYMFSQWPSWSDPLAVLV